MYVISGVSGPVVRSERAEIGNPGDSPSARTHAFQPSLTHSPPSTHSDVESIHAAADHEGGVRLLGHLYVRYFADLFGGISENGHHTHITVQSYHACICDPVKTLKKHKRL